MGQQRSIPLTPLRETVKFIAIEALDEAQRAFFLQHFFDFTGLDTSGAVCCGHAETDAARRAMPICQACGFDPEFVSELRSVAPPRG